MKREVSRKIFRGVLIGLAASALLNVFWSLGLFKSWQDKLSDTLFIGRPAHADIAIIAIDDDSISTIGRFPWDRSVYAKLLEKLNITENKPASVGLDVSFSEKSDPNQDAQLATALHDIGNVTLAARINESGDVFLPIEEFSRNASFGIANTLADGDGVTRFIKLKNENGDGKTYESFSLQTTKNYLKNTNQPTAFLDQIAARMNNIRINYIGRPNSYPTYSFTKILNGEEDARKLKNKIVLIGATASDLHDNQMTPTSGNSRMSGVEIQANAVQTLLQEKFLIDEPKLVTLLTFFVITTLVSTILIVMPINPSIIVILGSMGAYVIYAIFSFDRGMIRNLIYPPLGIAMIGVANIVYKYFSEFRQKTYIRRAFSYYLSESVMSDILANPNKLKLGGERRNLTVLFSDVTEFTSISERLDPEVLATLLNHYLTSMTNIIFKYNGVLDKYIGDAVMAFWGAPNYAPNHALLACQAAVEMLREVGKLRANWTNLGVDFDVRIGINTGEMIVGNMGSNQRFDYTLLGDNVNLGSRLEGINKEYGTRIVISEATYLAAKGEIVARALDTVAVKGKDKGVKIYELIGLKTQGVDWDFLQKFEEARQLYEMGDFPEALKKFKVLSKQHPNDSPTRIYVERLRKLTKEKPSKWDGVYHLQNK